MKTLRSCVGGIGRRQFLGMAGAAASSAFVLRSSPADAADPTQRGVNTCTEWHPYTEADYKASLTAAKSTLASPRANAMARSPQALPGGGSSGAGRPLFMIELSDAQLSDATLDEHMPPRLALERAKLWNRDRNLTWAYVNTGPAWLTKIIDEAFEEWQSHIAMKLVKVTGQSAQITVGFRHVGFFSFVGTDSMSNTFRARYSGQSLNIQPNAQHPSFKAVALHEIGHALGAIHEHQSPDAKIPWDFAALRRDYGGPPNSWSDDEIRYQITNRYQSEITNFTQFDNHSIMRYPTKESHLDHTDPNWRKFVSGWNLELSPLDISFMQQHYGAANGPKPVVGGKTQPDGKPSATVALALNEKRDGEIAGNGDYTDYEITVTETGKYVIETVERNPATFMVLEFFENASATSPKFANSLGGAHLLNARLELDLAPGKYTIRAKHRHLSGRGKYTIYYHAK